LKRGYRRHLYLPCLVYMWIVDLFIDWEQVPVVHVLFVYLSFYLFSIVLFVYYYLGPVVIEIVW